MDMNTFSVAQMTSNSDGKTSASGSAGSICVFSGVLFFAVGVVDYMFVTKTAEIMSQSLMLIGAGSALLGLRKYQEGSLAKTAANQPQASAKLIVSPEIDSSEKESQNL